MFRFSKSLKIIAIVIIILVVIFGVIFFYFESQFGSSKNQTYQSPSDNSTFNNYFSQNSAQQSNNGGNNVAHTGSGSSASAANLPDCPSGTSVLNTSPINPSQFVSIEPLGHLNGPHVLPSQGDHIYLYLAPPGSSFQSTEVDSPGNVTLLQVVVSTISSGYEQGTTYNLFFSPCKSLMFAITVSRLSSRIQNAISGQTPNCQNGSLAQICAYTLNLQLQSGEKIGTIGDDPRGIGLDFGAADVRTQPLNFIDQVKSTGFTGDSYLHAVCPLDYFDNSTKAILYNKLSTKNIGSNGIPACGTTMQDQPGTAQGNWYLQSTINNPGLDIPGLFAAVHSNIDPSLGEISAGSDLIPSSYSGAQIIFSIQSSGQRNREPSQITPDGRVYCFDGQAGAGGNGYNMGHVDILLKDVNTLQADFASGTCLTIPVLGSSSLTYVR